MVVFAPLVSLRKQSVAAVQMHQTPISVPSIDQSLPVVGAPIVIAFLQTHQIKAAFVL